MGEGVATSVSCLTLTSKVCGTIMASEVIVSVVVGGSSGSVVGLSVKEVISVGSETITFVAIGGRGAEVGMSATEVTLATLVGGSRSVVGMSATLVTSGTGTSPVAVLSCRANLCWLW